MKIGTYVFTNSKGEKVNVVLEKTVYLHADAHNALIGTSTDGKLFEAFSVSCPLVKQNEDEIFIKADVRTNTLLNELISQKVISFPFNVFNTEFDGEVFVCKLLA
jgi:hypothetical protein